MKINQNLVSILSLIVALAGVSSGYLLGRESLAQQKATSQYEVTFIIKQKSYAKLMGSLYNSTLEALKPCNCREGEIPFSVFEAGMEIKLHLYELTPFIPLKNQFELNNMINELNTTIQDVSKKRYISSNDEMIREGKELSEIGVKNAELIGELIVKISRILQRELFDKDQMMLNK